MRTVFWSCEYMQGAGSSYLPMDWDLLLWTLLYSDHTDEEMFSNIDGRLAIWETRIAHLRGQSHNKTFMPMLSPRLDEICERIYSCVQPSIFVAWNNMTPHSGIMADKCKKMGTPVIVLERGYLPDTWMIDVRGIAGASSLADCSIDSLPNFTSTWEEYERFGAAYLSRCEDIFVDRHYQPTVSIAEEGLDYISGPKIAFLGCDDATVGIVPSTGIDHSRQLPGFTSSFDACVQLSQACGVNVCYKPHPNCTNQGGSFKGVRVSKASVADLIEWCDVAVTVGSTVAARVLSRGKPLLLMGRDLISNKGVAYEALRAEDLQSTLASALTQEKAALHAKSWRCFVGYLLKEYLISISSVSGLMNVEKRLLRVLNEINLNPTPQRAWQVHLPVSALVRDEKVKSALLENCQDDRNAPFETARAQLRKNMKVLADIIEAENRIIVLDFDHTLFCGNTTERFLDTVRPSLVAFMLSSLAKTITRGLGRCKLLWPSSWFDQARVLFCAVVCPWSIFVWRHAVSNMKGSLFNDELIDAVLCAKPSRVIVISYGFRQLIEPICKRLPFHVELVCSTIWNPLENLRRRGKQKVLCNMLSEREREGAVFVSDSGEDYEASRSFARGHIIDWGYRHENAFVNTYLPLRFTHQGKYAGIRYVREQIFLEEFMLLSFVYVRHWEDLIVLSFAFLAFYAVYEIGYYENDFLAAQHEHRPFLFRHGRSFADYPIRMAWIWAIVLSIVPCALVGVQAGITWVMMLLILRAIYALHNRVAPSKRILSYAGLQLLKAFSYLTLLAVSMVGVIALISHAVSFSAKYLVYRQTGKRYGLPVRAVRLAIFVGGVWIASCVTPILTNDIVPLCLISGWFMFRCVAMDKSMLKQALNGIFKQKHG